MAWLAMQLQRFQVNNSMHYEAIQPKKMEKKAEDPFKKGRR